MRHNIEQKEQKRHSRLGIASFVLSLLAPLLCIGSLMIIAIMMGHASTPRQKALQEIVDGLWEPGLAALMLLGPLMLPVALLLGITGLMQKNRKKAFALTGTLISAVLMLLPFIGMAFLANNAP
ncbi:hypothetical protein AXE65_01085 [Ventosimonas gracilis]|uniref:Uncharacterized protein n=1 Tax=Ventosimonas gracilis TaxID=1680762 RepID=A0A139SVQ7_9GAMM|nr:hypothetical protein [Ventosimonas gracilis]KXU38521.1 hypothetical protein AXE65_01085 [Ventosimonas gracilis]